MTQTPFPETYKIAGHIQQKFSSLNHNMIVGISGRGGAGKSTLADQLSVAFTSAGAKTHIIHIDDFVFPIAIRDANPDHGKARYFDSYDFETLFNKLLKPLKSTDHFNAPIAVLNRQLDKQELKQISIHGPAIILVEGVQLFRRQFADVFDYKIWIDIEFEEGLRRAIARKNHLGTQMTEDQKKDQYINWSTAGYLLYEQNDNPRQQADLILT